MLRPSRDDDEEGSSDERSDNETDGFVEHERNDNDDNKLMKLHQEWKSITTRMTTKLDKENMKAIALLALVVFVLLRLCDSGPGPLQPMSVSKSLRRPAVNTDDAGDSTNLHDKKKSKHVKKLVDDLDEEEDAQDPTAKSGLSSLSSAAVQGLSNAGSYLQQQGSFTPPGGGGLGTGQTNAWATPQQNFMMPGLMQQQGQATQQAFLQAQQQQQQQVMLQTQQQQQLLIQAQAQKQMEDQLQAQQEAFKQQFQQHQQQQQQQQALMMQQQALMGQQSATGQILQPQLGLGQQPGMGQLLQQQGGLGQQPGLGQFLQPQGVLGLQSGLGQFLQPQGGLGQEAGLGQLMQPPGGLGQQLLQPGLGQMSTLQGQEMTLPGAGGQQVGVLPGVANLLGASTSLQQNGGLSEIGVPGVLLTPETASAGATLGSVGQADTLGPGDPNDKIADPSTVLTSPPEDALPPKTDVRPSDADVAKIAEAIPLVALNHFRESWSPYNANDIPIYFHVPKAGGSTVKDVVGSCLRMVMASEFGVTDGHATDTEIAIVYPKVPGGTGAEDRSPFVNVDTTSVAGIDRAAKMGFADSGLAGCVVTPFLYESNALFTETAQGRLFAVFRHPVDRAVSMFYYIQVADWEPSYMPELQSWTLEQYATSSVIENNWMTRQLANQPSGDLDESHLRIAMEVIRRKFMVGLMKKLKESMTRFEKFFRWKFHVNPTNQEACRERLTGGGSNSNEKNKKEKPKPGEPLWDLIAAQNQYDIQLFEYIETLFVEQEAFVTGIPDDFRNIDATCCKCDPPTFPPEGFACPKQVMNTV